MSLLSDKPATDTKTVSIPTLDAQYQVIAKLVLTNLFNTALLIRNDLEQAKEGAGSGCEIAMLRWLLRHRKVTRLVIHRVMREQNEAVDTHEMLQFTNFLVPHQ